MTTPWLVMGAGLWAVAEGSARVPAERIPDLDGVENVARVAPGIYRGAAPSPRGLDSLKALGIRTVVNLRHYHGRSEERACRERGLDYVPVSLESSDAPSEEDVRRFLEIVTDPARQPVYFHCWRGKDRTGVMCAAYRMRIEGWSRPEALREMESFGFFSGWKDLRRFVETFPERPPSSPPPPSPSPAAGAIGDPSVVR